MTDTERPTFLAWVDLETTGSDREQDPILEVATLVTSNEFPFVILESYEAVVRPNIQNWTHRLGPVVLEMHIRNGLLTEVFNEGRPLGEVESEVMKMLSKYGKPHDFIIAGSGVAHFDRGMIDAQMPRLSKWLRYYSIDVGVLRRSLEVMGSPIAGNYEFPEAKEHRGLLDIFDHRLEFIHYAKLLRESEPMKAKASDGS